MGLTQKAIRRLGLGDAASRLLCPLSSDRAALPEAGEALAALHRLHPDTGRSALRALPACAPERDVDVILPVYNALPYLKESLASALGQEGDFSFSVLAVDDGSSDGSGAFLDTVRDPRLRVLHQANAGAAAARNRGLEESRARYVLFLDADDVLRPRALDALLACAAREKAAIVEGAYATIDGEGRLLRRFPHAAGEMSPRDCTGFPHGKLFRAELFRELGFPEGYLFEDSVLAQLLYPLCESRGERAVGISEELLGFRVHAQNTTKQNLVKPASVDSLYVTLSLYRDRQRLGLEDDARYYEYLLNMLVLSCRRTERLDAESRRAIFAVSRDFLLQNFASFSTGRPAWRVLEKAVRDGDFGAYTAFASLH